VEDKGSNINDILIELAMGYEVDINNFQRLGKFIDVDGKEYVILIENDIPKERVTEISQQYLNQKINIRGHVYVPKREVVEKLKMELE